MSWVMITDDADGTTHGPFDADFLAERLKRLFAKDDDIIEACDRLAEAWITNDGDAIHALSAYLDVTVESVDDDDVRFGHELMAARETLGLSREQLATMVGVTRPRTVKAWEEGDDPVPYDVWERVSDMLDRQEDAIDAALGVVAEHPEAREVRMPYWRSQAEYDAHHYAADGGLYSMANATSRRIADRLADADVVWVRADENPVPRQ